MSGAAVPVTAAVDSGADVDDARYARLLDEQHHDAWLEQFTAQCMVWVPAQVVSADPRMARLPGLWVRAHDRRIAENRQQDHLFAGA